MRHFRKAGLSESSALGAARGLIQGRYSSFEHAALSQTTFDAVGNGAATPERIAEAAKQVPEALL